MTERIIELPTPHLRAEVDGAIGWLTFDNPARRNAMKLEMQEGLIDALEAFDADDRVRVVIMTGAGDEAFVSGADISEFDELRASPEARKHYDATVAAASRAFADFSKPLVAMIRGYCMGWGVATALHADLRLCADDAVFAIPAARLGVGFGYPGLAALVHVVGPTAAADILLTARRFDASEAAQMGLINQVVAVDELGEATRSVAERVVANAPLTLRAAKAGIKATLGADPAAIAAVDQLVEVCFRSRDYAEGRRAFMEKRPPEFEGR